MKASPALALPLTLALALTTASLFAQTKRPAPGAPPRQTPPPRLPAKPGGVAPVVLPKPNPAGSKQETLPTPTKPPEPENSEDPDYYPYGKLMTWRSTPQGELWTLKGDAQLSHKDVKFVSDTVLYNKDTQIASAPSKLRIEDPQNTLTSNSGVAYYKKELRYADLTGEVKIVARPKQDNPKATVNSPRKDFKSPVTITCDKLRYWWKQKRGFTDTNVKITFKHREKNWTITGGSLEYFGNDEHVIIRGSVIAVSDKGDRILGDLADAILKEGAESLDFSPVLPGTKIKGEKDEGDGDGRP